MKCKNCGHDRINHMTQDCDTGKFFPLDKNGLPERNGACHKCGWRKCKQFIPSEDEIVQSDTENKGCGKDVYYQGLAIGVCGGRSGTLCPLCSNNTQETKIKTGDSGFKSHPGNSSLENKDPDDKTTFHTKVSDSGSDFKLSDKIKHRLDETILHSYDVKEFIRLLKEEICLDLKSSESLCLEKNKCRNCEKIDKLAGDLK